MIDSRQSRRRFLGAAAAALAAGFLPRVSKGYADEEADRRIFATLMAFAQADSLADRPIGEVMNAVGRFFLGTPYVAHTLEQPGEERLVVNLREFDCVTFVENTLAVSRCIKSGSTAFEDFRNALTLVRYRSGVIAGYPSRLHYFTDWIRDNADKGIVQDLTAELDGEPYRKTINFMTTHTSSYAQLSSERYVEEIARAETRLTTERHYRIPRSRVSALLGALQDGDIVGTTTSMKGMDVSHTGMVIVENEVRRFLHAPLSGKQVLIAEGSLADYVVSAKGPTGIVVARPLEPNP